jgi:hypothetical protein
MVERKKEATAKKHEQSLQGTQSSRQLMSKDETPG